MRKKLQDRDPPWWVLSLITGVVFGSIMTVFNHLQHPGSWTRAIVGGLVMGVFFGAVMGPFSARQRRKMTALVGDLPRRDLRIAGRAVNRGPGPLDPDIRQAAVLLATHQLREASRLRWPGLVLFAFFGAVGTILALTDSPWWWIEAAMFLAMGALYVIWPRHLQRRIAILNEVP